MSRITLHPEFGVNPSLDICFWCGEPCGVALLGNNRGKEAPREVISGYNPCPECREKMDLGVTLVEVAGTPYGSKQPEIQKGFVPTGRWMVVREEAVSEVFDPVMSEHLLKSRKGLVDVEAFSHIMPVSQE